MNVFCCFTHDCTCLHSALCCREAFPGGVKGTARTRIRERASGQLDRVDERLPDSVTSPLPQLNVINHQTLPPLPITPSSSSLQNTRLPIIPIRPTVDLSRPRCAPLSTRQNDRGMPLSHSGSYTRSNSTREHLRTDQSVSFRFPGAPQKNHSAFIPASQQKFELYFSDSPLLTVSFSHILHLGPCITAQAHGIPGCKVRSRRL